MSRGECFGYFSLRIYLLIYIYVYMPVRLCVYTYVSAVFRGQKECWVPRSWTQKQLWSFKINVWLSDWKRGEIESAKGRRGRGKGNRKKSGIKIATSGTRKTAGWTTRLLWKHEVLTLLLSPHTENPAWFCVSVVLVLGVETGRSLGLIG